jgi:hypothetical protein
VTSDEFKGRREGIRGEGRQEIGDRKSERGEIGKTEKLKPEP